MTKISEMFDVGWNTAYTAIMDVCHQLLVSDPNRFAGVAVIGVDDHVWRFCGTLHFVNLVIDMSKVRDRTGQARLLDIMPRRSKSAFTLWVND